ncbi:MAG: O-antigen ligase family protein [Bacteroidota bacterium]
MSNISSTQPGKANLLIWTSAGGSILLAVVGILLDTYWLALGILPILGAYLLITKPLLFFWALIACLPLSVEFYFGSLGTDLPTEPLMIILTLYFFIHAICYWRGYAGWFYKHPISLLVILHLIWIIFSSIYATEAVVSWKFVLAKVWYIIPFYFLAGRLLDRPERVRKMAWLIFIPLLFVAVQTLVRHASYGFSFADQFRTMSPFMRNHVNYAGMIVAFIPWLTYILWKGKVTVRFLFIGLLWITALYFSYTRAAYVALILAIGAFWIIRYSWLKPLMAIGLIGAIAGSIYLVKDNNYLEYAPNYETTISHERFDNLISATYKLEDISTMERAYRWVAAGHMVPYHPWVGWGPGNFRFYYKSYTVTSFRTYVSDNPEQSGLHNYYLMTLVEQGFPGLIILMGLLLLPLAWSQDAYNARRKWIKRELARIQANLSTQKGAGDRALKETTYDLRKSKTINRLREYNAILMAAVLSQIIVVAFLLINDMLETDKMGSLFWINLAIMTNFTSQLGYNRSTDPNGQNSTGQTQE